MNPNMSGSEKSAGNNTQILRNTEPVSAHAVSIRVSAFWADKISLWFKQLEAQFMIAGITREATKFGYVVAHLEPKYVMEVEDIIDSPPENSQYEALKAALIKRLSDSSSMRVRKLLEGEEIGDRTPSQFLRNLRNLAGTSVNEEKGRIAVVSQDSAITALKEELVQLIKLEISAINRVHGRREKSHSRFRTRSKSRRPSQNRATVTTSGNCWYREKFGDKANKCREPCSWNSGNENSHH